MRLQWTQMVEAGKQTERIIEQMKVTEVRDLRAYVGVSTVVLNLQRPELPRGIVEIQNFGKTPAYNVKHWIGITVHSHPLTIVLPEIPDNSGASTTTLFPGIKNVNLVDLKKPLPETAVIGTAALTVYVYGRVTYEDAFGNKQFTNYRFFFGGSRGGHSYLERGILLGAMYPESEGNDAS